ncbi:MAG: T9SS type A sorting domain-containing protein [Bacteroidia bacterium]|nr:T9SS type A sorting domain-containing protein [Bacteroidia bacterium]
MDNFQSNITVSLFDRYTNKTTDVRKNSKYTFDMGPGVNQWGNNRFELILNLDKTNVDEFALLNQTQMLVYPNPATDLLNINISNANFKNSEVVVYNISGAEVLKTNMEANNAALNIETLSAGVYFVKVSNQNGFNKTVKFVK